MPRAKARGYSRTLLRSDHITELLNDTAGDVRFESIPAVEAMQRRPRSG